LSTSENSMKKTLYFYPSINLLNMKKIFFILVVICQTILSKGQAPFPSSDEIKQFLASKTCVVLENDPFSAYNAYIKEAVKSYWNITPYEFIETKEFNVRRIDPAYSFIVLTETNFDKDKSGSVFNFINLLQGKKVNKLGEAPEICAVPLSFAGEDDFDYGYKLGAILSFIQKHAKMISEDPSLTGRKYLRYYNKFVPEVSKKTILVKKEDLAPEISTIESLKAIYPYDIKIVAEDDIVEAIIKRTPNTLFLHKVGPVGEWKSGYCFKMLIGADDATMYYYNQHLIDAKSPNGLLESDLKRLARF
jgi:hypothetical protein